MVTHESGGHHHPPSGFIRKYIFSLDHKVIGIQYYFLALFSVFVGMALSMLMRIHLVWPNAKMPFTPGGQMTPEQYLALVTMHGSIMVFMVLTTAPQSGFGNYMLPIQIGAEDMAFPVLNMLSFWTTFVSLVVLVSAFFVRGGAPISGWTAYPTLSALGEIAGPGQGAGQNLWIIGVAIFCIGSLLGALNFITTTVDLRARGMTLGRMPLTVWAWLVTAILGLLAFGVLLAALTRPRGWNELFHSRRARRDRYTHRFAHRWFAAALAALILVLRASRSLHRHPSGDGRGLARPFYVLT
jgi:cytochrome c oxidase subunit 1